MIRGTTPTHNFKLPFDGALVKEARAIYRQLTKEVLRKETKDFEREGNILSVLLSQEETFLFDCTPVTYQLRVKTTDGKVLNTKPRTIKVEECLDSEVL